MDFSQEANNLLNNKALKVKENLFRLQEIEFYYYSDCQEKISDDENSKTKNKQDSDENDDENENKSKNKNIDNNKNSKINKYNHKDEYVHKDPLQIAKKEITFYPHQTKKANGEPGNFKGGTFKGFDIVMKDNENLNIYYSVLVRSMRNLKTGEMICGPCKCAEEIIKSLKKEAKATNKNDCPNNNAKTEVDEKDSDKNSWNDLLKKDDNSTVLEIVNKNISLVDGANMYETKKAMKSARFGLSDKYPEFQKLNYRFAIEVKDHPYKLKTKFAE